MILTLTPNPSFDRTVALDGRLDRGQVHRVVSVTSQAGGKGVNISRAAVQLGVERTNLHKKMRSYGIRRDGA